MNKRKTAYTLLLGLFAAPIFAQDQVRPTPAQVQQQLQQAAQNDAQSQPVMDPIPPKLTIKAGTYVTVHLTEVVSSDRSLAGDAFTAALVRPIVVNGVVVAQRGQSVTGRVTEVKKSGHFGANSRLGIQLIDLPVVDGQQLTIRSELMTRNGTRSTGRDTGTVTAASGAGAAGVLLTHGNPTVIYPETALTFRVTQDVTLSTEHSAPAFHYVEPADYEEPAPPPPAARRPPPRPIFGYGYPYPFWGPSLYFGWGPRW